MLNYHLTISSKKRKNNIINEILNQPINNNGVVNIHRLNPNNIGDYYCAPHQFFKKLEHKALDISDLRSRKKSVTDNFKNEILQKSLIIGGGGLFNIKHFNLQMEMFESLSKKGKKIVIWGAGHNEIDYQKYLKTNQYWIDTSNFGLTGTRDYANNQKDFWIPCVSCLDSSFDKEYTIKHDIGLLFNHKSIKDNDLKNKFKHFPISSNTTDMNEMIEFIGSSDTLVTNVLGYSNEKKGYCNTYYI
ncbi:MAG: hypothetical protein ACTIKA_08635 [Psychroflexus halocasei]|uniref:hypothetical protein n=1 Tax=Psychroflexus sp. S27 TaxID=1982757 RepID=UPI000C296FBA|nr:hypothetical protein [Psychroflexus sp. S27]PJX20753.1 hypothetical protein CAP47_10960 [Psychroflexus sp. S27]